MNLPYLRAGSRLTAMTDLVGGLHLTEDYKNGRLESGLHLSFDAYPGLGVRRAPCTVGRYERPQALFSGDAPLVIANGRVLWDGADLGEVTDGPKQLAAVNKYILIFPDKKYVDTEQGRLGEMEAACTVENAVFSGGTLTAEGTAWPFRAGDAVAIEGCTGHPENSQTLILRSVETGTLLFDDNVFEAGSEASVTLTRRIPDLEVICESGNRLNFFVYDGLSTDSYALTVSGDGPFTGCAPYGSYILFFRENMAHKLYGTRPANYQLMTVHIPGVRKGCSQTLWNDSEDLYYLGPQGVYAYSGGVPALLSAGLGEITGDAPCGCVWLGKYYLSAVVGGKEGVYTFDTRLQAWLPWAEGAAAGFAVRGGMLYIQKADGTLQTAEGGTEDEDWEAAFRPLRDGTGRNSRCTSFSIDADPEDGAWFAVEIREARGEWQRIALFDSRIHGPRPVPLPPNRGMRLQIRLVGHGACRIRSIERRFRMGSDVS